MFYVQIYKYMTNRYCICLWDHLSLLIFMNNIFHLVWDGLIIASQSSHTSLPEFHPQWPILPFEGHSVPSVTACWRLRQSRCCRGLIPDPPQLVSPRTTSTRPACVMVEMGQATSERFLWTNALSKNGLHLKTSSKKHCDMLLKVIISHHHELR